MVEPAAAAPAETVTTATGLQALGWGDGPVLCAARQVGEPLIRRATNRHNKPCGMPAQARATRSRPAIL